MFLCFSKRVLRVPDLSLILGNEIRSLSKIKKHNGIEAVIGWGKKYGGRQGLRYARSHLLPYLSLEEGFIAYPPHQTKTVLKHPTQLPYSIIVDSEGIYYDATRRSALETLLNQINLSDSEAVLSDNLRQNILTHHITKYNDTPITVPECLKTDTEKVLLVEQIYLDKAISCGLANAKSFYTMLDAAIDENPHAQIILKTHPRIIKGLALGYLTRRVKRYKQVVLCADYVNPIQFLNYIDKVYTVSSQMGFEALLLNKEVRCFGMPFYANWGLTNDELVCTRRKNKLSLQALFYGAYVKYPTYFHPVERKVCELPEIIEHIALQHQIRKDNKGKWLCIGFKPYKKRIVRSYLQGADDVRFSFLSPMKSKAAAYDNVLIWGSKYYQRHKKKFNNIHMIEDGFIRSTGLGATKKIDPMSLIMEKTGIYYDARQPSALEVILNTYDFSDNELTLAKEIVSLCLENKISKYNLKGSSSSARFPDDKKRILVPGQVPDDVSIQFGTVDIKHNLALLQQVRECNENAFIIYKPHPDVVSGFRKDKDQRADYLLHCDMYLDDADIIECLGKIDEVHTLTSLTGFEALMRGKTVFTYGLPFYAGWGLTSDRHLLERRKRKLSLEALIAGALLIYPRYFDLRSNSFMTVKNVIELLRIA